MYRFGIVYIFNDGSTSPVFNISGGEFVYQNNEFVLNKQLTDLYEKGIVIMPKESSNFSIMKHSSTGQDIVNRIYLKFIMTDSNELLQNNIKGWFVVRQKRIPNTICQGLSAKIDYKSHVPLV